jgi:hypothetical protein
MAHVRAKTYFPTKIHIFRYQLKVHDYLLTHAHNKRVDLYEI